MKTDYSRGHKIVFNKEWLYEDTLTPVAGPSRPCGHCGMERTEEGHDGCLGTLLGDVMNACCGHGEEKMAYVQFWDGERLGGSAAIKWIENQNCEERK